MNMNNPTLTSLKEALNIPNEARFKGWLTSGFREQRSTSGFTVRYYGSVQGMSMMVVVKVEDGILDIRVSTPEMNLPLDLADEAMQFRSEMLKAIRPFHGRSLLEVDQDHA